MVNEHAFFCFGRFNPPTIGHIAHFNEMRTMAAPFEGSVHVFTSKTERKKDNPLSVDDKLNYLRQVIPVDVSISACKDAFEAIDYFAREGTAKHLWYAAGDDYMGTTEGNGLLQRMHRYASKFGISLNGVNTGDRKPNISATVARNAAATVDWTTFRDVMHDPVIQPNLPIVADVYGRLYRILVQGEER